MHHHAQCTSPLEVGKQMLFPLAQCHKTTGELEFHQDYKNVLYRIQQACGSEAKLVFATAVGQQKSGKTRALNRLLSSWNRSASTSTTSKFPQDSSGDFEGIRLLFNDVPIQSGQDTLYLVCLDVICQNVEQQHSTKYKTLMEACDRMSNLIIFTFSKETYSDQLLKFDYGRPDVAHFAVSFDGYADWFGNRPFYSNVDQLRSDVPKNSEILQALLVLPPPSKQVPVQFEHLIVYSDSENTEEQKSTPNIYYNLVNSSQEQTFKKQLYTTFNLLSVFDGIISNSINSESGNEATASSVAATNSPKNLTPKLDCVLYENEYRNEASELGSINQEQASSTVEPNEALSKLQISNSDTVNSGETCINYVGQSGSQDRSWAQDHHQGGHQQAHEPMDSTDTSTSGSPPKPYNATQELQLKASYKKLALSLIASFATAEAPTLDQCKRNIQNWQQRWNPKISTDKILRMGEELERFCQFFLSCQEMCWNVDLYQRRDQLEQLYQRAEVKFHILEKPLTYEKAQLAKPTRAVMYNILETVSTKNQAIIKVETLLVQTIVNTAWASYSSAIDELLKTRVFNDVEIERRHKQIVTTVMDSFYDEHKQGQLWKQNFVELETRMTQNFVTVFNSNARNSAQLRKNATSAYRACQLEFDRLFREKSEFSSIADLKSHTNNCVSEALKNAEMIKTHRTEYAEIQPKLQGLAFAKMMKCASSDCPRAPEVLATKCKITAVVNEGRLEVLKAIREDMEPINLDTKLWLKDGKLTIVESRHFLKKYEKCPSLDISSLVFENPFDGSHPVVRAISPASELSKEEIIAAYFKQIKEYLIAELHLLPVQFSFEVCGHPDVSPLSRLHAAVCIAGFQPRTFWIEDRSRRSLQQLSLNFDPVSVASSEDPEKALAELSELEARPMQLRRSSFVEQVRNVQDPEAGFTSNPHPQGSTGRSKLDVMKEELGGLVIQLEKDLQEKPVPRVVAKNARIKLEDAKKLIDSKDVSQIKLDLIIKKLKYEISSVTGSNDDEM